jgi:protease-4
MIKSALKFVFTAIFSLILIVIAVPLIIGAIAGAAMTVSEVSHQGKSHIAVLELTEAIMDSKDFIEALNEQLEKPSVKGIVVRIDSPGGAVGPSQEIYSAIKKGKEIKPIVASMGAVAASGGLYSALGATKILAQPGTLTGSIGVIIQMPYLKKIADFVGVDLVTLKSGQFKDVGNPLREMSEAEKALIQKSIDTVHGQFMAAVSESRGIEMAKVKEFADGRVIVGSDAKELGLIDDFGGVNEAARLALELSKDEETKGTTPYTTYPMDRYKSFKDVLRGVSYIRRMSQGGIQLLYR